MDGRETESTAMPSLHSNTPAFRFLGFPNQPESNPVQIQQHNPLELDESDVVWSSSSYFSSSDVTDNSPPPLSTSPSHHHHLHHHQTRLNPSKSGLSAALSDDHHHQTRLNPSKSGLSAALSDDHHLLVRRKSTLNPSISATSAAKTIPPVNSGSYSNSGIKFHQSAPVNVPAWPKRIGESNNINKNGNYFDKFDEVDDELEDEDEMVPPHVMVARSHVTFSVFEGVGRTLKGRDLRRLRNTVFQQTGFLE